MGLAASQRFILGLTLQTKEDNVQPQRLDGTKLEREQTRLLGELKKTTGENNPKLEYKEIPADVILKIMDEMSKNVAKVNDIFKEA